VLVQRGPLEDDVLVVKVLRGGHVCFNAAQGAGHISAKLTLGEEWPAASTFAFEDERSEKEAR
jgi:hypothetical protein